MFTTGFRDHSGKKKWRDEKNPEAVSDFQKAVLSKKDRAVSSYELTMIVTPCTRLAHAQAKQNPSMEDGWRHEILLLAGKLLAFKSYYEMKSQFSLIL